jgi:glycosyltransferase involved in cell wall biosynthesis/ubiquinone/menaquinone biosynthesis C-methylase UbiE
MMATVLTETTPIAADESTLQRDEVNKLAGLLLSSCGNGPLLHVGPADLSLLQTFLSRGVQVTNVDLDSSRVHEHEQKISGCFKHWDGETLPFADDAFTTVLVTGTPDGQAITAEFARQILRVSDANVFLYLSPEECSQASAFRKKCEAEFFQVGARKHPAYYRVNDYQALQLEQGKVAIPLEKLPAEAALEYPLSALVEERDLHMDMTREPGSRSDAHIIRYMLASRFIRPGDRILDAACGLGYGSHILLKCSDASSVLGIDGSEYAAKYAQLNFAQSNPGLTFKEGWLPEAIVDIPDNSIDLITSFETLEHVKDPKGLLAEFHRVLTPTGRIVLSVPNDWSDETGEDPNPFHFHVYTWAKILEETKEHFLVEAAYAQTADQFKRNKQWAVGTRQLFRTSVDTLVNDDPECEWCLLVGMKTPLDGASVPYTETTYDLYPDNQDWHVTRFDDYQNPWLVKGLVTIGHRIDNPDLLQSISYQVALDSPDNTPDQGAGLCVLGYQLYGDEAASFEDIESFDAQCQSYLDAEQTSPQQLRWQVSLCYLLAQIWQKWGRSEKAIAYYQRCVAFDCTRYSPTLITKQVNAYLNLGLIESGQQHLEQAKAYWRQGVTAAEQALKLDWKTAYGSLENPTDFGLHELGAIVECAASCAYALKYSDNSINKTPQWWHQLYRDRVSQLRQTEAIHQEITRLNELMVSKDVAIKTITEASQREANSLYANTIEKDLVLNQTGIEIQRLNLLIETKDRLLGETGIELQRLNMVIMEKDHRLNEKGQEIEDLTAAINKMLSQSTLDAQNHEKASSAHVWTELELNRLNFLIESKDSLLNEISQDVHRLTTVIASKDELLSRTGEELNRINHLIAEKDALLNQLGNEINRINASHREKELQLSELGSVIVSKDEIQNRTSEDLNRINQLIAEKDALLNQLGNEINRINASHREKELQLSELGSEQKRLDSVIFAKDELLSRSGEEIDRLNRLINDKDVQLNELGHEINRINASHREKELQLSELAFELSRLNLVIDEQDISAEAVNQQLAALQHAHDQWLARSISRDDHVELEANLNKSIADLSQEKQSLLQALEQEQVRYAQLRQTRLLRWRDAVAAKPLTLRGLAKVAYFTTGLLTPEFLRKPLRSMVSPMVNRLRKTPNIPTPALATEPESGYIVKLPSKPEKNRPVVVHIIANFMTGGSSRLVVDIFEYLGNQYDQRVVTSYAPTPAAYIGIPIDEIRFPNDEAPFIEAFKEIRPDFIHMHYWGDCDEPWYAKSVRAAEILGIPVIENINTPVAPFYSDAITRYVYVSDYVRHVFGNPQDKAHVTVYPGSDFSLFESKSKRKASEDCIGMVYRLESDKLNSESIMPFILAVKKKPSVKVLIVGGGSLMEQFMKATEDAGVAENFEFTGYVSYASLPSIYERMNIFVAPVWKESFGQVSPFAMNMRVPVVGFDIGAIGEIVDDPSLLAPAGNSDALADIIVSLLNDTPRRQKIAERHRKRAQDHYSIQAMIKGYRGIYNGIMVDKKK